MRKKYNILGIMLFLGLTQVIAQAGLVAHWSFEGQNGDTLIDRTIFGNHGTNYGGKFIPGIKENALYLDGKEDYARIPGDGHPAPDIFRNLGEGSISVWFRIDNIPTRNGIAPILYYGSEEKCDFWDAANQGLIIEIGHDPIHLRSRRLYFTIWHNGCTIAGRLLEQIPLHKDDSHIKVNHLPDGYYFLDFVSDEAIIRRKFLVLK